MDRQRLSSKELQRTRCFLGLLVIILTVGLGGCATISPYSATAYEQATSLKAEALVLMGKATEPYSQHQTQVEALKLNLEKAYEYAKGRPKNELSIRQWEILKDPERHSLGGFLKRWQQESSLRPAFVQEAKELVADQFDAIIGLESGKPKTAGTK
ncbi:hypothetical protein [Desulfobacca acetoxidans]|uniref:Lipoprotein n=1 Tax=Desulfobacca acetoxidans (strain ATCC 700848 / DSM 11109 / ASRB2) TaxID=880072 RepID=F2NCY2_DESAR|nr:hypothetical protein [Desulfobacca acetoxidans]AEB09556.1 conserved hypothetical protein, secreted [Desulfobacca acetoxidans DSM 11109]